MDVSQIDELRRWGEQLSRDDSQPELRSAGRAILLLIAENERLRTTEQPPEESGGGDEPPAAVVVPVGNGALIGGIGRAVLAGSTATIRVGVVAAAAPVMADSFDARRAVPGDSADTFADGLAVRVAIPYAVNLVNEVATHMLRVSERELAQAVGAFADAGIRVEGAAAAALAALPQVPELDGPIVLIVTGRNIDEELLNRARNQPQAFPA